MTTTDPGDWMDVVTITALALIAAVPSWYAARNHRGIREIRERTEDIKTQVVNGHAEPMRTDLDRVLAAIDALTIDVRTLREELVSEAHLRRAQVQDLREDMDFRLGDVRKHQLRYPLE